MDVNFIIAFANVLMQALQTLEVTGDTAYSALGRLANLDTFKDDGMTVRLIKKGTPCQAHYERSAIERLLAVADLVLTLANYESPGAIVECDDVFEILAQVREFVDTAKQQQ